MSDIKLKDLLKENFSGTLMGGVVSRSPFHSDISLSKIVKEKYGDIEEDKVDVQGLTSEISSYNKLGESIFGESNITKVAEKLSWIANQAKSHTLSETEDWFDKITVNRNMKELTGLSGQFGKIAKEAKVKKLILGHYSSRYINKNIFFNEASTVFKDVDLSEDFKTFLV